MYDRLMLVYGNFSRSFLFTCNHISETKLGLIDHQEYVVLTKEMWKAVITFHVKLGGCITVVVRNTLFANTKIFKNKYTKI